MCVSVQVEGQVAGWRSSRLGSVEEQLNGNIPVLVVYCSPEGRTSAVLIWGGVFIEKQRKAGSVLIIVRMEDREVHRREPLVVLPLYIDILQHVLDLRRIAIFDVGVEETSVYDGGEEAPF